MDINSTKHIFKQFDHSINWNGILYLVYKSSSTVITFALFKKLTTSDFSIWANTNSIIFLLLLWMDFGFRKSIPYFAPLAAQNKYSYKDFIKLITIIQAISLIAGISILSFTGNKLLPSLLDNLFLFYLGLGILLTEAPLAFLKLIHHAHFWNKEFNLLNTKIILLESITNIFFIMTINNSHKLLQLILIAKIFFGLMMAILATCLLSRLYKNVTYLEDNNKFYSKSEFLKHSGAMWVNTSLKSLTERNFLVPALTYAFGGGTANIFKLANDWALLFQRVVLKTIGTSDTSLLAHMEIMGDKDHIILSLKKLMTKIGRLLIPLFGVLFFIIFYNHYFFKSDQYVFQIFLILVICYMLETLLSPFERILEVKRYYVSLFIAHIPFVLFVLLTIYKDIMTSLGLLNFILLLCSVRLVSYFIIVYRAHKNCRLFSNQTINLSTLR